MSDLETKFAKAREQLLWTYYSEAAQIIVLDAMNVASAIAREVVAEKDAEIARLEASRLDNSTWLLADKPRKVTDAQREAMRLALIAWDESDQGYESVVPILCEIVESTGEPAAKGTA
jgi:hypothetical protein